MISYCTKYHTCSFLLFEDRRKLIVTLINVDTGTQKSNDLSKVTLAEQGPEPIYSIYIKLLPQEASCP